jgi:hypothetical protein
MEKEKNKVSIEIEEKENYNIYIKADEIYKILSYIERELNDNKFSIVEHYILKCEFNFFMDERIRLLNNDLKGEMKLEEM